MKKGIGKFTTILLFCTFFQVQTYAFDVTVGLFNDFSVQASVYTVISGSVVLSDAHRLTKELHQGDLLYFSCWGDSVHVRAIDGWGGTFKHVDLHADPGTLFSIRPVYPAFEPRFYEGDLEVFFSLNRLQLNNIVDSEIYLAGVVESEGGNKAADAFYQAQAILARTYLMKNLHRHAEEGFQVCDGVHCQAFKGINQNAVQIMAACRLTKGLVVTDQEGKLISAFFHSNCGGETATGESVWLARQSYLSSVQDQFCSQGRNFTWHKNIPLKEWINYIKNIYPSFSVKSNDQLNFSSSRRAISYVVGSFSIPFNKVRADWNLKSAFFSVTVKGDRVELSGRGYGHGVGLCQEGAMHMARLGYSYQEIVSYYFKNVNIINFDANKN